MLDTQQVIADHYPNVANNKLLNKPVNAVLKRLLCELEINTFNEKYPHLSSYDYVEQVLSYFSFTYNLNDAQRERIPDTGKVIIVANHPIGSLDGLALIKCIKEIRSDVKVVANDLLMAIEPMHDILLPVNNMQGNTPKQNLHNINMHLQKDAALIIFPAGEVSRLSPLGVRDVKWQSGFLRIAKTNQCSILPVHLSAKNSPLFYGVSMLYKPASTALLIKEMFNQKNKQIDIRIGEIIPYDAFSKIPLSNKELAKLFRKHTYRIAKNKPGILPTRTAIALPEERRALVKALQDECEMMGETSDGKSIYLYRYQSSSPIMRELGRLRELTFRAVGEGTNERRDIDKYDKAYFHLILWDKHDLEIAGAYRFADVKALLANGDSIYSASLFDYKATMTPYFEQGLELGRSFVQTKYWGKRSLDYLWMGIGAYLKKHPEYRYLFGPVTLSGQFPKAALDLITQFYSHFFPDTEGLASAKQAYISNIDAENIFVDLDYKTAFTVLKSKLSLMNLCVPTLFKQYAELCEPDGVRFSAFNIDPDFQNCVDALVMVDITKMRAKKRRRYLLD